MLLRAVPRATPQSIRSFATSSHMSLPWFVDLEPMPLPFTSSAPPEVPDNTLPLPLKALHAQLSRSPLLEPSTLVVRTPMPQTQFLSSFDSTPKGKRKRGRTYAGEGLLEPPGGIWSWILMAQVKEGTENRGTMESVVRGVRKTLLSMKPPLPLPPNSRRRMYNGWAMIDAGEFAVHVLTKEARLKFFPSTSQSDC